jgi:hypothetical protein
MTFKDELELVSKCAKRASNLAKHYGCDYKVIDAHMDLSHAKDQVPIDLQALLDSDDGTFGHDMFGIRRHMNRATGKLEGCFLPRTARMATK